ncbi:MAG: hypothetical protein AMXMBFR82_45790 [Candidatus Hydrogenedentota bacterium]
MRITPITAEQTSGVLGDQAPPLVPNGGEFHESMKHVGLTPGAESPEQRTHVVERGQNLWHICRDHLSSRGKDPSKADVHRAVMQIAKANGLRDPNLLSVGQRLDISGLSELGKGAQELAAAVSAHARVGTFAQQVALPTPSPKTVEAPTAPIPATGKQRFAMPEPKQPLAMPEPSGAGKHGSAIGLPRVATRSVPPLRPHSALGVQAQSSGGQSAHAAVSRKNLDIAGLIQSILEPGSMTERESVSDSPWSRVLGGPARLTSKYGMRKDPFTGRPQFHDGIDIAAKSGTKVFPSMPGKVTFSGWKPGYGKVVVVEHANGLETIYGHASKLLVKAGDTVTADSAIAQVGSTGRSTGPHLHFEVRKNDVSVDPLPLLTGESLHVAEAL